MAQKYLDWQSTCLLAKCDHYTVTAMTITKLFLDNAFHYVTNTWIGTET